MTQQSPEEIRAEIERTRQNLSTDVDAVTDKVSPSNIAQRQTDKVKDKVNTVRERIMGSADDAGTRASDAASSARDTVQSVANDASATAQQVPSKVKRGTQGNPLAAGLIALGAGMLVASLLPVSDAEKRAASRVEEKAEPVLDEAKQEVRAVAEDLKEPAQEAASTIKDSAVESAQNVKSEGQSQTEDVVDSAKGAADDVRSS